MLINVMYGEGPNLLGWSVTVVFLAVYLNQIMENKTGRLVNVVLAGITAGSRHPDTSFPGDICRNSAGGISCRLAGA